MQKGKLYLIPTVLAEGALHTVPAYTREVLANTDFYIVENLKSARRFIKAVYHEKNIDDCVFMELNKHQDYSFDESFLNVIFEGKNMKRLTR